MAFDVLNLSTALVKEIRILRFLQYKDYKTILLFALCFEMYFFDKNLIVLHHGHKNFFVYFNICIKFTQQNHSVIVNLVSGKCPPAKSPGENCPPRTPATSIIDLLVTVVNGINYCHKKFRCCRGRRFASEFIRWSFSKIFISKAHSSASDTR